jgi:hypothetical protein
MPNHSSKPKRPRDVNQLAKAIVDLATGQPEPVVDLETETPSESLRQAAAELGRRGGLKGGKARAASLTPEKRSEIAKKAARARWRDTTDQSSSSSGGRGGS